MATDILDNLAAGRAQPLEALQERVVRLQEWDPKVRAAMHTMFETAVARVRALEHDDDGALLRGVPISLKGNLVCAGTPTHNGTMHPREAEEHGELVRKLLDAGAIPFVKSNVPQLLMLPETVNHVVGRTLHPTHHDRTCGGSSGGEAVLVALDVSPLGFGTDIGGSIRIPASFCGVYGFKPTPSRVPVGTQTTHAALQQAIPTSSGPLARCVEDLELAMRVICHDHAPWRPALARGAGHTTPLRWGFWSTSSYIEPCATQQRAVEEAAQALLHQGGTIRRVNAPDLRAVTHLYFALMSAEGGMRAFRQLLGSEPPVREYAQLLLLARLPSFLRPLLAWVVRRVLGEPRVADLILCTGAKDVLTYFELQRQMRVMQTEWQRWMDAEELDVLLLPACPTPAFQHGASRDLTPTLSTTFWANLLQCPAAVSPWTTVRDDECAYVSHHDDRWSRAMRRVMQGAAGLPVGVQVMTRPFHDETAMRALRQLARA